MTWKRTGYCCRCGDCCKGDPGDIDGPRAVAGYCPLFEWHHKAPEGEGFCIGHEPPNQHPYYLQGCNVWPTDPAQIEDKPRCTYKFEWVDDGN